MGEPPLFRPIMRIGKRFAGLFTATFWKSLRDQAPLVGIGFVVFFSLNIYLFLFTPAGAFPVGSIVTVPEGATLTDVAVRFEDLGVIRSPLAFRGFVTALRGEGGVIAGDYFFSRPWNAWEVAKRVTSGEYGLVPVRVTVPEGATREEMAAIFEEKFGRFRAEEFLLLTKDKEGYLFPDTYFFLPNVGAAEVARVMESQFNEKMEELAAEFEAFGKPLHDVVTMASLIEKEAHFLETRRMISGILWNRLEVDMPLQVDAVFLYINGKNTYELTLGDLRNNDSPYNTYKHKGLPPGPIASPGLNSLLAALTPTESDYLYYLSDRSGNMYYAETFEEHKRLKQVHVYNES